LFLTLGGDFSLKVGNKTKHFSQDVVQTFFITEKEYQKKNGITKPDSNKIVTVGSTNFKKYSKFYEGDIVYFIGTENIMLNNDMPYKVQRYDQDRDFIRINGVILKASEVISKKEYEEYNNIDDQDTIEIIGKPRTEIELKHQLWKDTKTGKLRWYRPFASVENWYRTIHILDKPEDSYLRFDLYHSKIDNKWALKSFFHRKKPEIKITESFEFIREYRETSILKLIANFVQNNIKE
jgi:hypothetical protein